MLKNIAALKKDENITSKLKALLAIASIDITLEFERILHDILSIACEAVGAHSGTVMLIDDRTGELRMVSSHNLGQDYIEKVYEAARKSRVSLTSSPPGTVLKTGKYYLVPNVFEEPKTIPWHDLSKKMGFSSQIFTPMKWGNSTIGLLNVYWELPRKFSDDEIDFVTAAASQAASVVQNAKLNAGLNCKIQELNDHKDQLEEEIKQANKELYESEARYRTLFENANDCFYIHDAEGYFKEVNNASLRQLGCTREELIGTHMSEWITPESLEIARNSIINNFPGGDTDQEMELEVICKNGEHRWMEIRRRLVREGDRITAVHGIGRDITEKKKLEQQLKEYNEKLERSCQELIEADRAKTEFISNITHELLTPLTSIKGFTELLRDETAGNIIEKQKNKLDIIYRNTERLIVLIRELVDIAHLEKHKFGLHFGLVSMNEIITRSIQDINFQAKEKEISIIPDMKRLPSIWGDEARLNNVMTNLLSNAIKFTPRKGTVTITACEDAKDIRISVTDNGIGIPDDKLSRIFERFYQIDGSSKRKYGGAGIGLSICKSIIERHYGSIWAESTGCGSTFNIVLPKLDQRKKSGSNSD